MSRVMPVSAFICITMLLAVGPSANTVQAAQATPVAQMSAPATMPVPADYREWIFLTAGLDMTYNAPSAVGLTAEHHSVFDNVFVNPDAYRTFRKTGTWPDDTTFVLENRIGEGDVSINKAGKTQGHDVTGLEIHRKLHGEWAFYVQAKDGGERLLPRPASCYTCHEQHAAVDTTFVQFYPTLLPMAKEKHTLSEAYLRDPETKADAK